MDLQPRALDQIRALVAKGVDIPNPLTLDIGPEVDLDRISGDGVRLYPGTRIYGAKTVISAGVRLGEEGPVTVDDCRLGPDVRLKGGYAGKATFLAGATMGLGHHVREGTLLEEEAGGAHTVGLKQTILLPFVTLGSLINFCDCLMAGGTSRSNHSEVGSSYIHFNFTTRGDKTTPSLFGDVPRGVMLDQPPVFLGGQGGAVGPVHVGYGSVVGAGSILRSDVEDAHLVVSGPGNNLSKPLTGAAYRNVAATVRKNVRYVAQLRALALWHRTARAPFFAQQELGDLVAEGALEMLDLAVAERVKRLRSMIAKVDTPGDDGPVVERIGELCTALTEHTPSAQAPDELTSALTDAASSGTTHVDAVRALDPTLRAAGTAWLGAVVEELEHAADAAVHA